MKKKLPQDLNIDLEYASIKSLKNIAVQALDSNSKIDNLMNILEDENFLFHALGTVKQNRGALTPGIDLQTTDAVTLETIQKIAQEIKNGTFRYKPVKRIYIDKTGKDPHVNKKIIDLEKSHSLTKEKIKELKARPLGIPCFADKVVQEAIRLILNAIYEPTFAATDSNFGFRPKVGVHDAINKLFLKGKNLRFAIEADISGAFDNVDFTILMSILRKKIADERFLKLILGGLKCGIFFSKKIEDSKIGTTQGSLVSPILYNIYFHEFDTYLKTTFSSKIEDINRKECRIDRAIGSRYNYASKKKSLLKLFQTKDLLREAFHEFGPDSTQYQELRKIFLHKKVEYDKYDSLQKKVPTRKLRKETIRFLYVRYADDWIFLTNASHERVLEFKDEFQKWLESNLKLSLSPTKTKITDLYKEPGHFLGFQFKYQPTKRIQLVGKTQSYIPDPTNKNKKVTKTIDQPSRVYKLRTTNPSLIFAFDRTRVLTRLVEGRFIKQSKGNYRGRSKTEWTTLEIPQIIIRFNYVISGYANFYGPVTYYPNDIFQLHYLLTYSCAHTIANKLNCSIRNIFSKYGKSISVSYTEQVQLRDKKTRDIVMTERQKRVQLLSWDQVKQIIRKRIDQAKAKSRNNEPCTPSFLINRTINDIANVKVNWRTKYKLTKYCAICGSTEKIEYHHVKHIKVGKAEGFLQIMKQLNRKQIPCCKECHIKIHKGLYNGIKLSDLYDEQLIIL